MDDKKEVLATTRDSYEPKESGTDNDVPRPENKELRRMVIAAQDEIFSWNARRWGW